MFVPVLFKSLYLAVLCFAEMQYRQGFQQMKKSVELTVIDSFGKKLSRKNTTYAAQKYAIFFVVLLSLFQQRPVDAAI